MTPPSVQQIYQHLQDLLGLASLYPLPEDPVLVRAPDVQWPGMLLMGFTEN